MDELDKWFRNKSLDDHSRLRSRVTTAHIPETGELIGYHCLSIALEDETQLDNARKSIVRANKRQFASLRLDLLAVKEELQRKKYGIRILANAVDVFHSVIRSTGLPVMTLVAIDQDKVSFYETLGFKQYGKDVRAPRMLLPAEDVILAYQSEQNA